MTVALVYTGTTSELVETVEQEIYINFGKQVRILSYRDPSILTEIGEAGKVTKEAAARLVGLFMQAVEDGADGILNVCSSVGLVVDAVRELSCFLHVPIVRIDEDMCKDAVKRGKCIGVLATLPTTMEPTKQTLKRVAVEMDCRPRLVEGLISGAFGLNQEEFREKLLEKARELEKDVDLFLLCQGSMAYCGEFLQEVLGKPVVSSPGYGAMALKKALEGGNYAD